MYTVQSFAKAVRTFETSVNIYQTTLCHTPKDSILHNYRHEDLKSHVCNDAMQ
jgi:hypothetical protein